MFFLCYKMSSAVQNEMFQIKTTATKVNVNFNPTKKPIKLKQAREEIFFVQK